MMRKHTPIPTTLRALALGLGCVTALNSTLVQSHELVDPRMPQILDLDARAAVVDG